MAICRGIVEAHGGRIRAESAGMGLGARFTFTLPVADGPVGIPRTGSAWTLSPARGENRTRILVVDDDPQTLRYVRDALSSAGYACTVTGDPEQVGSLLEREKPHLVLLDLLLPGTDGIGLMERLPMLSRVPVIFLSAYGRDQIIAQALEAGADDYIVKPFSPTELVARIRTVLRRRAVPATAEPAEPFVSGELTIDYGERRVSLSGRSIHLTDKEYRLLYELSVNAGRVVPHDHLLQALWGPGHPGHPGPVRTVVKNLRRKLGEGAHNPTHILNEPRIGYRMPRQHQGVRGAPGGSPGPLGLDSVCSSRYVVMLRKVRISLSRMACLGTFRGLCPRGILDGYPVPPNFHQGRWVPAGSASSRDSMYRRKLSSSHMLGL